MVVFYIYEDLRLSESIYMPSKSYYIQLIWSVIVLGFIAGIVLFNSEVGVVGWILTFSVILFFSSLWAHESVAGEIRSYANRQIADAKKLQVAAEESEQLWKQTMLERNAGFKTLTARISEYEKLRDDGISNYLSRKSHPAYKAAEIVKEQTQRRRKADLENKITQSLIEMYEQYAPFLADLKNDLPDQNDLQLFKEYTEEERQDEVINYLTKEEYRKLSSAARNQLALDRFWQRPKSNWLLGKLYERYIGFLYEQKGFKVQYFGITERYEDLGRDLICTKGSEIHIVQCKNWSQFKTIYEKHIFQLFGTYFEFKDKYPSAQVVPVFYSSTQLSEVARRIANALGIEVFEQFKFDRAYPCIKCNINPSTNEKIYHLPFDQKYDDTKIDRKGEFYCATVAEAEAAGFRRAFRWRGNTSSK